MSQLLTAADFQSSSEPLTVEVDTGSDVAAIEMNVDSVSPRPSHRYRAEPFSLFLSGPPVPLLPQGTYRVRHPTLGSIDLFIVPVGRDTVAARYEVVFN